MTPSIPFFARRAIRRPPGRPEGATYSGQSRSVARERIDPCRVPQQRARAEDFATDGPRSAPMIGDRRGCLLIGVDQFVSVALPLRMVEPPMNADEH